MLREIILPDRQKRERSVYDEETSRLCKKYPEIYESISERDLLIGQHFTQKR